MGSGSDRKKQRSIMKAKILLLLSLFLCAPATMARTAGPIKMVRVAVVCEGKDEDTVGRAICFNLKEKIRASSGFQLIEQLNIYGTLTVHILHLSTKPTWPLLDDARFECKPLGQRPDKGCCKFYPCRFGRRR